MTNTGNPATVTKTRVGAVTITASLDNCYASNPASTIIEVGVPPNLYEIIPQPISSYTSCFKLNKTYTFTAQPTMTDPNYFNGTYQWVLTRISPSTVVYNLASATKTVSFIFPSTGTYTLKVRRINSCGNGPYSFYEDDMAAPASCSGGEGFRVSPNPATNAIKIEPFKQEEKFSLKNGIQVIQVIDKMGVIKSIKNLGKGVKSTVIQVNNLPTDVYTLRIYDGTTWYTHKIIIKH